MCGVLGLVAHEPVNQLLYDGLQMLQHRGQDAAGIVTVEGNVFHMHKGKGMVRDVFRTRNMRDLAGRAGIAHVRYPTAGNAGSSAEAVIAKLDAADIANAVAETFIAQSKEIRLKSARTAQEWLRKRVEEERRKLESTLQRMLQKRPVQN